MKLPTGISPELLRVFETLPNLYLVFSPDWEILTASNAMLEAISLQGHKLAGQAMDDLITHHSAGQYHQALESLKASLHAALATGKPDQVEQLMYPLLLHGEKASCTVVHTPVLDENGSVSYIIQSVTLLQTANNHVALKPALTGYMQQNKIADSTAHFNMSTHVQELNEELASVNEELLSSNEELAQAKKLLEQLNKDLEARVVTRTQEMKRAQEEAELQRARLERFLMQAPAIIVIHSGPELVFEFINPLYQQVFPGRKLLGKPLLEGLPELAGTPVLDMVEHVYATGETYYGKEVLIPLAPYEGAPLENNYYNFIYQARFDENGKVDGIMVFAFDVTDLVKARKQVEENEALFRTLLESIPQMTWTSLPGGEVNFYSKRWHTYTGLDFDQIKGWAWPKVMHPDDAEATRLAYLHAVQTGENYSIETRIFNKAKDGYEWHLNRAVPLRNEKGEITLWVGTATNIHEQKKLEETLQETSQQLKVSNKELSAAIEQLTSINTDMDNFIYAASHDLKAPISNIEALLAALLRTLPPESIASDRAQHIITHMQSSIERFKKTIANLTEVVKLQKDDSEGTVEINLNVLIEEVLLDLEPMEKYPETQVKLELAQCPTVRFKAKNLRSIIYNLLSNAIKYQSPDRPLQIKISSTKAGSFTKLVIEDNGLGMTPMQVGKLFTMFRRFHDHIEGSGIGLYMVKKMVSQAGGKIEVQSHVDKGSVFNVYLPQ